MSVNRRDLEVVSKDYLSISSHQSWIDPGKYLSPLQRRVFNWMEYYRSLVRTRGGEIKNYPIPKVFYTTAYLRFKMLYEKLVEEEIDHRLYIQAQFMEWKELDNPYPSTKHFMDPTGDPTYMGLKRWAAYKEVLEEKWKGDDIRKEADLFLPLYDSEFEDSKYFLDLFMKTHPSINRDASFRDIGLLLSPYFVASHRDFMEGPWPSLSYQWAEIWKVWDTMGTDRYLSNLLDETRKRVCGY